jgi:nuclear mRNA export protein PCID2/THP1
LHTSFNQVFAASPGNLLVPALHAVCKSTHRAALAADREEKSLDYKRLQNAVTLLQESFSRTYNDRKEMRPGFEYDEEGSKKAGVLGIVNELFAIYFRLNTLRLCKNLVRPVESRRLHEQAPMGQMVTYRYFTGRLALFEDQFALAEENLEYAFKNCHRDAAKNKELILHYLIPVKLYRGRYPSPDRKCSNGQPESLSLLFGRITHCQCYIRVLAVLTTYNLQEYVALVEGVRKGDLRSFNESLIRFQHRFIR